MDIKRMVDAFPRKGGPQEGMTVPAYTVWGENVNPDSVLCEHPRPQFARQSIQMLHGWWDYAFVDTDNAASEWSDGIAPTSYDGKILVPFAPEAPLSGVGRVLQPDQLLVYHRQFAAPELGDDDICLLHFDAVDYECDCYLNGKSLGTHVGGYLPFSFDITNQLKPGVNELHVVVFDPTEKGT